MQKIEKLQKLNSMLLAEMPYFSVEAKKFGQEEKGQRQLLRSLMNIRKPNPVSEEFLALQDSFLQQEAEEKGRVDLADIVAEQATLFPHMPSGQLFLWQGDITRLAVDAIVNAANNQLLGCFVPCHACIDNIIHSYAGVQLREACHHIMQAQGHEESTGMAKITPAYNLPSKYVLHTVGPIIHAEVSSRQRELLANCYRSCLQLALENSLESIAFCCISTGEFRFPPKEAAKIALQTVQEELGKTEKPIKVIFNVFKDSDYQIYKTLFQSFC